MTPTPSPAQAAPTGASDDDPQREFGRPISGWRLRMYIVIFEADTEAGRRFDLALIAAVLASVLVVMLGAPRLLLADLCPYARERFGRGGSRELGSAQRPFLGGAARRLLRDPRLDGIELGAHRV